MATEEGAETTSPLDDVMEDIRRELVRRVADSDVVRELFELNSALNSVGE